MLLISMEEMINYFFDIYAQTGLFIGQQNACFLISWV